MFFWLVEFKGIETLPQKKVQERAESTGQLGMFLCEDALFWGAPIRRPNLIPAYSRVRHLRSN